MIRSVFLSGAIALASLLSIGASLAAPQFIPPNGLPLETPLGPDRKADGTGVVTFRTLQQDIARNSADIAAVAAQGLSQSRIDAALTPYLKISDADTLYLPQTGGTITGDIIATAPGGGGTTRFGAGAFYGLFTAPGNDLKQGSGMAWNSLGGIAGSGVFGETDFYNLKGLGSGGFTFCNGASVGMCKANILLSIANTGVVFSRGSSINGNEAVSGSLIVSSLAGTGNAFACLNAAGQLYRSATACQ